MREEGQPAPAVLDAELVLFTLQPILLSVRVVCDESATPAVAAAFARRAVAAWCAASEHELQEMLKC